MTVSVAVDGTIILAGDCSSDDAEVLLRHLLLNPTAEVDWINCDYAHTSVVQVLLAARPVMQGPPRSSFLVLWIEQHLSRNAI